MVRFHLHLLEVLPVQLPLFSPHSTRLQLGLHSPHEFVVPLQDVGIGDESTMHLAAETITMCLCIDLEGDEVIKDMPNVVGPVVEEAIEGTPEEIKGDASAKLEVEELEVVVEE